MHKNSIPRSQEAWCFSFQGMSEVLLKPSFKPQHYVPNDLSTRVFHKKGGALLTEWGWRSLLFCHLQLPKRLTLVIAHPIIKEFSRWFFAKWWNLECYVGDIKQLNCETSGHITSSRNHEFIKRLKEIQRILKEITSYHMFLPICWMLYLCS